MEYNLQEHIQYKLDKLSTDYLIGLLVELTDMNDIEMSMYVANEIKKRHFLNSINNEDDNQVINEISKRSDVNQKLTTM